MKTHESQNSPLKLAEFINLGKVHPGCHKEPHFRTFSSVFFLLAGSRLGSQEAANDPVGDPPPRKRSVS